MCGISYTLLTRLKSLPVAFFLVLYWLMYAGRAQSFGPKEDMAQTPKPAHALRVDRPIPD